MQQSFPGLYQSSPFIDIWPPLFFLFLIDFV